MTSMVTDKLCLLRFLFNVPLMWNYNDSFIISLNKDANQARPMTAVRGAGYSSAGNRGG